MNRTLSSVGGTVAAACAAWEEYVCRHEFLQERMQQSQTQPQQQFLNERNIHLCWSAHVAGGTHHAFSNYGEGFCIFSDIAVAANVLLQKYSLSSFQNSQPLSIRRILIIDLDVHQGNGNAALFHGNKYVWTFSMHCRGNYFSKKETSDLDVELPVGCEDETYLTTLRHWLKQIERYPFDEQKNVEIDEHKMSVQNGEDNFMENGTISKASHTMNQKKPFDLIFYQAGVDIHHKDRLGRLSITDTGISRRNALVFDFAHRIQAPLVICMGGGYPKGEDWTPILDAHVGVYWEAHQFLSSFHIDDVR